MIAPSATREALLEAAADHLQRVGWASFSFRDLAAVVGIRAPSIHHHFPTKGDLGVALVGWMRQRRAAHEASLMEAYPDPRDRLLALGDVIAEHICAQHQSCPIYALQAEFPVLPEAVQKEVSAWIEDAIAGLTRWLAEGRTRGSLRFPGEAADHALVVWSVLQQGTQLTRTRPGTDFRLLVRQLVAGMTP